MTKDSKGAGSKSAGDPRDFVGNILYNMTSPEAHAAFITSGRRAATRTPTMTERLPVMTDADWLTVKDAGPQVTPEMLAAGEAAFSFHDKNIGAALIMAYRAMRELEPSATLTLAPDVRLVEERDALQVKYQEYRVTAVEQIWALTIERDEVRRDATAHRALLGETIQVLADERVKNKNLLNQIASLTAEKNHLYDELAKFAAANVADPEISKHDPFREFPNDPRRMGR